MYKRLDHKISVEDQRSHVGVHFYLCEKLISVESLHIAQSFTKYLILSMEKIQSCLSSSLMQQQWMSEWSPSLVVNVAAIPIY